ncbi:MAG: lysine--tRNA ligase [Legionellales bacterium]|nr:lysine--tRNA ligase [Legionellales bacterium]
MTESTLGHDDLHDVRRQKLAQWRVDTQAYPNGYVPSHQAKPLYDEYRDVDRETLSQRAIEVILCGRMMTRRLMGKASFVHIQDGSGHQFQIYLRAQDLPQGCYDAFKQWDLGDILYVKGVLFRTQTDELSLAASEVVLLSKALWPMPDKFHGLQNHDVRYRQRYLDLMVNPEVRTVFVQRAAVVAHLRAYLTQQGFMEVETPMMQPLAGGACAKPFQTHHNALDLPLYLRIAPELYLKRLIVSGFDRVFELNRNFRNEGISTRHNPEFTMVEFYQAYADYLTLMSLTEDLLRTVIQAALGTLTFEYQGHILDFSKPFERLTMTEAILRQHPDLTLEQLQDHGAIYVWAQQQGCVVNETLSVAGIQMEIFEKTVEKQLFNPTFITAYPSEYSPLARRNDEDPSIADRFEFFMCGQEIANGFSELNDPEDQAERFKAQVAAREAGDAEAMHYDADYIKALEYGMPPTAGEGIGIDRLIMCLTDSANIRDVILFPLLRPE